MGYGFRVIHIDIAKYLSKKLLLKIWQLQKTLLLAIDFPIENLHFDLPVLAWDLVFVVLFQVISAMDYQKQGQSLVVGIRSKMKRGITIWVFIV